MVNAYTVNVVSREGDLVVLAIAGELSSPQTPELRERVLRLLDDKGGARRVILDLGAVGYASSSGIGALMEVYKSLVIDRGMTMTIRHASTMIRDVIALLGYSHWLKE